MQRLFRGEKSLSGLYADGTFRKDFLPQNKICARTARNLPVVDCFRVNIMLPQPVCSKFFPLCSFHAVIAVGVDGEAAAGEEFAPNFDVPGMEEVN